MTVTGQASTYCPATGRSNAYDANGYPDVVTDDKGNVTNFDYNAKGQLLSRVEAQGTPVARTTLYTWDSARNRITQVTVVGHSRTAHTFTADNRLASVTVTNLTANGVASQARTTNYTYTKHANGLLATMAVDGPLPSDTVTSTYSAVGDLLSVRNGLGHTTSYGNHNALGQPGRVTGPNGAVTEFIYDERGRITAASAIVNGVPQTTRYTFDGAGRPTTVSTPDNVTSTREYDAAGRVLREYQTEAGGTFAVKEYTYNNASQPVSITVQRTTAVAPVGTSPPTGVPTLTTPATDNDGAFTISWTSVSTATSYEVRQRKDGGAWSTVYNSSGLSQGVSGLVDGNYEHVVRACNIGGCAAFSGSKATVVTHPPGAPTVTAPTADSDGAFTVSWSSVSTATSYRLEQRKNGGTWSEIYSGTGLSKGISGLTSGTYDYQARACNAGGCGSFSTTAVVSVGDSGGGGSCTEGVCTQPTSVDPVEENI